MLRLAFLYLRHFLRSRKPGTGASELAKGFVQSVLQPIKTRQGQQIEALRKQYLQDGEQVEIRDLGAGYGGNAAPVIKKTKREIARGSARRRKEGELLYRICAHYQPQICLELGTNLGFSTLYQASAVPQSHFMTIEGSTALAAIAKKNFLDFGLDIQIYEGEFSSVLKTLPLEAYPLDYVFLDGNHRLAPTLAYFEFLLPFVQPGCILVLDDIYWSDEMRQAWEKICAHQRVRLSLDLFHFGICFLDLDQAKEHYYLTF